MKNNFDLIVLIQSYPNLLNAVNYVLKYRKKRVLILVNGDRKIFKFLSEFFNHENIKIKIYGNNIFLTSRFFSWLLPVYVTYLYFRIPTYKSKDKLITYGNWCDVGALFFYKTNSKNIINLIAYEEKKYSIQSCGTLNLPVYIKVLNYFTKDLIERKKYFYEEDGATKFITRDSFGMIKLENVTKTFHATREKYYNKLKHYACLYKTPFILYIEKNILKSGAISYSNFLKLNISIYRLSRKNRIPIGVKFKPRDKYFFRKYFYKLFGFKILPSHVPAQLYSVQDNCKFIIGFSSSSMAENYGKSVYSFGSINSLFSSSIYGNINSLKQRSEGNNLCYFLEKRIDLENLK